MTDVIPYLGAAATLAALPPERAVRAIVEALRGGLDPANDAPRTATPLRRGEFLMMPSESGSAVGVKVLTLAPDNPRLGRPRVQGFYALFDPETLTPHALLDGASVTSVRTPAVSLAAVRTALLQSTAPLDVVIFGAGPQAREHRRTLEAVLRGHRTIASVTTVRSGSPPPTAELGQAGLVICATTARAPLFDSTALRDDVVVVAVGSHEPAARELDSALLGRAQVIIEDPATALRECGDVILAIADGALTADDLISLADVCSGRVTLRPDQPVVFKSSGMSWEDLVIAEAIVDAYDP